MKLPRLKQIVPATVFLALLGHAWAQDVSASALTLAAPAASPISMPPQPASTTASGGSGNATPSQQHIAPLALKAGINAGELRGDRPSAQSASPLVLHLIVGRSFFLNSADKLRRVYVSNPTVLDAMTASPFEVVITAKAAGTSSLVMWATAGEPKMYTVLADVDVAGLRDSVAQALPGDQVEVQAQQGRIHLTGVVDSDAASDEAARLAAIYSKDVVNSLVVDPRHLPQVQLEVRIAEIDRSKLTEFGINLFSLGKNSGGITTGQFSPPSYTSQNGSNSAVISDFLNLFYFNFAHGLGTTIRDLQNKGILQILAEPTLTTIHGRTARFLAGGQFPYPIVQPGARAACPR
jgi:pilus assembly protein CpaC